ncbi:putative ribonuclease H-like domain-containing protein [Tanacetum coccineum]
MPKPPSPHNTPSKENSSIAPSNQASPQHYSPLLIDPYVDVVLEANQNHNKTQFQPPPSCWVSEIYSMAGKDEFHDDNLPPPPPPVTPTQQAPRTLLTIKLPILKKGDYDIWAMKMEHYLGHTDYPIWEVIQKGNGPVQVSTDTNGQIRLSNPDLVAKMNLRRCRNTFSSNNSKSFSVSNSEGLHKGYDRFQSLLSQLEIHGACVSTEDANQKFLRSLPASWSQVSLIMRTKPGVDTLSFDDLYNNLRVFESDIKGSTASSSSTQNVAFVSPESTNSTNDISTAYGVSTSSGYNSQKEGSSSYIDELKYSFFANQSSGPQLDHEDFEQVDEFDLEEMDLKWQVAMISMRLKKFYKKTRRRLQFDAKELVGFDKTKVEYFNCHNTGHFARECRSKGNQESRRRDAGSTGYKAKDNGRRPGKQEEPKDLVTLDGDGVDWTGHAEDKQENFALMAHSNSGSNTEVTSCSKEYEESYAKLKKLYDEQREQLGVASIEIQAYSQALKKVEAQLKLLAEAVKEKEELKTKLENFQSTSKGLSKLTNSQMSTRDKSGLGYGNQIHEGVLSYEKEVLESVFDIRSSDVEDSHVNDRFTKVEGMHAVPPPMTRIYMPSKFDFGIDESNVETPDSVSKPAVNEPTTVSKSKVCSIPKADKRDWNDLMSKKLGLGYGFTKRHALYVAALAILLEIMISMRKEWLNRQNPSSQAAETSTARKVNTTRPIDDPQKALKNKGIIDSRCSKHMTGNKAYLIEYQDYNGGHVAFGGSKGYISGKGPNWLFDLDYLTDSINYQPVTAENKANKTVGPKEANHSVGTQDNVDAGNSEMEAKPAQEYLVLPLWSSYTSTVKSLEAKNRDEKPNGDTAEALRKEFAQCTKDLLLQAGAARATSTNTVNTVSIPISTASPSNVFSTGGPDLNNNDQDNSQIPALEDIYDNPSDGIFTNASYDEGAVADFTNLETTVNVDAMQEEQLQFKIQKVWILVDLPFGKKPIRTKWVYKNKKDERGVVVRNKARIKAIRIFLVFASYIGFIVYQMDVKSAFLYGIIYKEVYVSQHLSFVDSKFPKKVYKVVKALYGLHQAPRAWYTTLSTFLLNSGYRRGTIDKSLFIKKDKNDIMLVQVYVDDIIFGSIKRSWCDKFEALMKRIFQMSSMGELTFFLGLQVKQKKDGIFISHDKYVVEILKKFDFASVKTASTPIETQKSLTKDEEAADVDVHLYRSMIGSLMCLTAFRPDIMFAVCAYYRFQVTSKTLHLHAVKRIFRRLISWQCKKQTIVAASTTEAEYVAAANCCGQVL